MKVYSTIHYRKYLKNKNYRYFCQRFVKVMFHECLTFSHHYKPNIFIQEENSVISNRWICQKLFQDIYLSYYPAPLSKKLILYMLKATFYVVHVLLTQIFRNFFYSRYHLKQIKSLWVFWCFLLKYFSVI